MVVAFLGGLGKAPTFLVPIINPPFADNSPHSYQPANETNSSRTVAEIESRNE
jgi:hypothetical protein